MAIDLQAEAEQFIIEKLGQPFTAPFAEHLRDVNKLKPGSVKGYKKSKMPFVCMENIVAYTTACKATGLPDNYNFVTVDLWEAANIKQVALNVVSLKRQFGYGHDKVAPQQIAVDMSSGDQTTSARAQSYAAKDKADDCVECGKPITSGHVSLTPPEPPAYPRFYHVKCFNCKKCGASLKDPHYHQFQIKPYCDKCILIVDPKGSPVKRAATKDMGFKFT